MVLVGRERTSGMTMAAVIPKGGSGKFMMDRVMKFLEECGDQAGDIVIKTDQEAAIKYIVRSVVIERQRYWLQHDRRIVSGRQPSKQRHLQQDWQEGSFREMGGHEQGFG